MCGCTQRIPPTKFSTQAQCIICVTFKINPDSINRFPKFTVMQKIILISGPVTTSGPSPFPATPNRLRVAWPGCAEDRPFLRGLEIGALDVFQAGIAQPGLDLFGGVKMGSGLDQQREVKGGCQCFGG